MEHLIAKIKAGDYKAFLELYHLQHRKVYHFFLKRVKLSEPAEELTQDCFIKCWQYRESLSLRHTLEKQLFIICYSLLINYIRKRSTAHRRQSDYLRLVNPGATEQDALSAYEAMDQLGVAVEALSPAGRQVVTMKVVKGYSNQEIAKELDISTKTVEGHITRSFKILRKLMTEVAGFFSF